MKVAVITGASGGLGEQFVKEVSHLPDIDEIWMIARRRDRMEKIAESVEKACRIIKADLSERNELKQISVLLAEIRPEIHLLINNAGVTEKRSFCEQTETELENVITVNVTAPVLLTRMCLPYMGRRTSIINIASVCAFAPFYDLPLYAAAKRCMLHFGRALDAQLEDSGISVLTVCPGNMETGMNSRAEQAKKKSRNRFVPYLDTVLVARGSLKAAEGGRKVYTPGIVYRLFHLIAWLLPDSLLLRVIRA